MIVHTPTSPQENDRRTPAEIATLVREVLWEIDLDPASDEEANKTIQARTFYSSDGLMRSWYRRVFLNPPGGLIDPQTLKQLPKNEKPKGAKSSVAVWWARLLGAYQQKAVTEAIFLSFNLECMLNTQRFALVPTQAFPFCVPRKRLCYPSANGSRSESPQGASALFYLGTNKERFAEVFSRIGYVRL